VLEEADEVVFLKRLEEKPAEGSYGIHVAKLAGLPTAVLQRARAIQSGLEAKELSLAASPGEPKRGAGLQPRSEPESLFSSEDLVLAELSSIDTDRLTPLDALNRLSALKKRLRS
jgi:DNA mismatch repair protein MutS